MRRRRTMPLVAVTAGLACIASSAEASSPRVLLFHEVSAFCNCSAPSEGYVTCEVFDGEVGVPPSGHKTGAVYVYVQGIERLREVRFGLRRDHTLDLLGHSGCEVDFFNTVDPPPWRETVGYVGTAKGGCRTSASSFHRGICGAYQFSGPGAVRVVPHPDTGKVEIVDCDGVVYEVAPEDWAVAGFGVESHNPCTVKPVPRRTSTWSGIKTRFPDPAEVPR